MTDLIGASSISHVSITTVTGISTVRVIFVRGLAFHSVIYRPPPPLMEPAASAEETPGQHAKQGARRTCAQICKTSALRFRLFTAHRLNMRLERQLDVLRQAAPIFPGQALQGVFDLGLNAK